MKSSLTRVALISLTLGASTAGYAQEPVPIEFYRPLKNSVSVGVRMIGGNAKVGFSNLGHIPARLGTLPTSDGNRFYDNGAIAMDGLRTPIEVNNVDDTNGDKNYTAYRSTSTTETTDANGKKLRTTTVNRRLDNGGRYQNVQTVTIEDITNATATVPPVFVSTEERIIGDYLKYKEGSSRYWNYNSASQANPATGALDMSIYGVSSSGATAEAESDQSTGVELQFSRVIKRYKRFEWGFNFSAGASEINAKTRQQIRANLITTTDRYFLDTGSSFRNRDFFDAQTDFEERDDTSTGTTPTAYKYEYEMDHLLNRSGMRIRDGEVTADGALVSGYWQVKGAYYLFRVGPMVRVPFAKKWTVSASAGFAGAYVGSRFLVDEHIELPDVIGTLRTQEEGSKKAFVTGYYGDVNIEHWMTVRTGFFAGYGYEKIGSYTHGMNGRKADIDLGSSSGFRFGIITRF